MSPAQEGAYIRLLAYDWANDGIPDNDQSLSQLSRLGEGWFKGGSDLVKSCFNQHPTKVGFLTNQRLQKEREKQAVWREKSSRGGNASALSRSKQAEKKGGSRVVQGCFNQTPTLQSSAFSLQSSNKTPTPLTGREVLECFAEFWAAYPKKEKKPQALAAFKKGGRSSQLAQMLVAIDRDKQTQQWQKDGGQFIPHPSSWLNAERWLDEPLDIALPTPKVLGYIP